MKHRSLLFSLSALALACNPAWAAEPVADKIWRGGHVVTIDDKHPKADAVAVKDGKIIAVGSEHEVNKTKGDKTEIIDLAGATLLPGFIDAHGHVSLVGFQATSANLLPAPDGTGNSIAQLQKILTDFRNKPDSPAKTFGVLFGFGYDDSQLDVKAHPTREQLDVVATDIPVVVIHQSAHLGAFNSKALEMAGISAATANPEGGVIRREADGKTPNGVLEENALFEGLKKVFPQLTPDQAVAMMKAGEHLYLKYGYTTIQDGRASPDQVKTGIYAATQNKFAADIVAYPDILEDGTEALMVAPWYKPTTEAVSYNANQHYRIGGIKITLDGSPQGKTAWLSHPYLVPPDGRPADYAGYGVVADEKVKEVYNKALANHWQVLSHTNGDQAIQQMLDSLADARSKHPGVDVRPVMIHGQTIRKEQVARLRELGIFPSLFPMHTFYWGDWYVSSVLGNPLAQDISPTQWVLKQGLKFTTHHDAPVAFPDSIRVLSATVNRTTRSGVVLGPDQRVDTLTGLKAMTLWPAYQHFEEKTKGSIAPGKLADFVVLSENPLTLPEKDLINLKVLKTIKEGNVIYDRSKEPADTTTPPSLGMHGDPSLPVPAGIPKVAQGDGDLGPALEVIFDRIMPGSKVH
ncbi:MAG: amidohydrolase [Pseudomonas sp.]|uniref:amidohydrolase n=1 Tax=Pseudomonas sp. TaxID=306 RepID=UPI003D12DCE9